MVRPCQPPQPGPCGLADDRRSHRSRHGTNRTGEPRNGETRTGRNRTTERRTSATTGVPDPGSPIPGSLPNAPKRGLHPPAPQRLFLQPPRRPAARRLFSMLERLQPVAPPWDAIEWPPQCAPRAVISIGGGREHRGNPRNLRDPLVRDEWKASMRPEFLWEPKRPLGPANLRTLLHCPDRCRPHRQIAPCDQDIAEDGFFSLAMIARFELRSANGAKWFYRRLFWECGRSASAVSRSRSRRRPRDGHRLLLREPVHDLLGLSGHAWQELYHFSMGYRSKTPADERTGLRVGNVTPTSIPRDYRSLVIRIRRGSTARARCRRPRAATANHRAAGEAKSLTPLPGSASQPPAGAPASRALSTNACAAIRVARATRRPTRDVRSREHQANAPRLEGQSLPRSAPLPPGRGRAAATSADPPEALGCRLHLQVTTLSRGIPASTAVGAYAWAAIRRDHHVAL